MALHNYGTRPTGIVVAPQLVLTGLEAMGEQFEMDPQLPVLGQDPLTPNSDFIVAPRGRLGGVKNPATATLPAYAQENRSLLTLANGSEGLTVGNVSTDVKPLGFFENPYFRSMSEQTQPRPQITRGKLVCLPYVQMSNAAYGPLKPGDKVTAYYGTATSGSPLAQEVGKVVKWVPNHVLWAHQGSAGTTVQLSQAIYPAFRPTVILAQNAGAYVNVTSATYSYVAGNWQVVLNAAATDVMYSWGQYHDNAAGEVVGFTAVGNAGVLDHLHDPEGWLKWVRDDYDAWTLPPLDLPRPFQTITGEILRTDATGNNIGPNTWRLATVPLVPSKTIAVYVTGTRTDPTTNVTTTLDGTSALPLAQNTFVNDYTYGQDFTIDPITGILTVFSNVTVTSATVSYSAGTRYIDGRLYSPGVQGLTDGRFSGVPGTEAHLELFGCLAEMRVALF